LCDFVAFTFTSGRAAVSEASLALEIEMKQNAARSDEKEIETGYLLTFAEDRDWR